tara:strand:- start:11784 stop:13142 length:1359 start_codon:yes stop_codon:yes gene_type:complete
MNQQLVQGAGLVAQSDGLRAQAVMKNAGAWGKMFNSIGKQYFDYRKEVGGQYDEVAQKVLDTAGELPAGEYEKIYDELADGRNKYINGNKKERALLKRDINLKATDLGEYKEFRNIMSELQLDKENGLSNAFVDSDKGREYLGLLKDVSKLSTNNCPEDEPNCPDGGRMGVFMTDHDYVNSEEFALEATEIQKEIDDLQFYFDEVKYVDPETGAVEEMSEEDQMAIQALQAKLDPESNDFIGRKFSSVSTLKQSLSNFTIDKNSRNLITNLANNHAIASGNVKEGTIVDFPEKITRETVASTIIGKSENMDSLIYDEMIPGRTFYGDLLDMISGQHIIDDVTTPEIDESAPNSKENVAWGNTYADLGITTDQLALADVNGDNVIDADEAKAIANELLKTESNKSIYLSNYYTQYIKQQWNNAAEARVKTDMSFMSTHEIVEDANGNKRYVPK